MREAAIHVLGGDLAERKPCFSLRDGPKRYGELKRLIQGVSDKVLIQQLKDLDADQVLVRTDYQEVPPCVH